MTYYNPTTYYYSSCKSYYSWDTCSLGGRLTYDADCNDNEWNDETNSWDAGVAGKTVYLIDYYGRVVASTITDSYGTYKFEGIKSGTYKVKFPSMDGYEFSKKDSGVDDHYDSDANPDGTTDWIKVGGYGCSNDIWNVDAGLKQCTGSVSGTVFCDTDCDGINGQVTTVPGCDYIIEAEHMWKWGFSTAYGSQASGGKFVKMDCLGGTGDLSTMFNGKTGTYDVEIRVQDENDGQSTIMFKVDGQLVQAIKLNRDSDGSGSDNGGFSTYVIKDVAIEDGDKIQLWVDGDGGEFVRIDNIKLLGHDMETLVSEPTKEGVTVKLVDLNGSVIATTTTDANGNYKFDDVPVGQYKIMGVAPDGTHFTIQDVDGNTKDDIDSDVDENGMSGVITVVSNGNSDVDLGVCDKPEPGSLSGRYFCDTNDNNQDDGNGGEPAVPGVVVMLLDANGDPAVDIDGNPVASTVTDANGEYSFGNLAAGSYTVKFTDPNGALDGKTLIDPNVGDDASDSDAIGDTTMSVIEGIVVVEGQDTPDNDAGVEEVNNPPEPEDDLGAACADEAVKLNVLGNDSDPDGDNLTITAVDGQAITEGGSVTIASGAVIMLMGGQLVYDVSGDGDDFDGLLIGQHAEDSFTYTVDDGNGGEGTASVAMTICGDVNTIETVEASLPAAICFSIDDVNTANFSEAFTLNLFDSGDARLDGLTIAAAYCLDALEPYTEESKVVADLALATADAASGLGYDASVVDNLDLINWIINQDFTSQGYTDLEVQGAIWTFTNGDDFIFGPGGTVGDGVNGNQANVDTIVALASANGEGYTPGEGDLLGLLLTPTDPAGHQPFIVAVEFSQLEQDCDCDPGLLG